jgi:hypothetical protein
MQLLALRCELAQEKCLPSLPHKSSSGKVERAVRPVFAAVVLCLIELVVVLALSWLPFATSEKSLGLLTATLQHRADNTRM